MSYINTRIDFFDPSGPGVLTGVVVHEFDNERIFEVEVQYGERHGQKMTISVEDVIEDSDFPEEAFERLYKWYSED